MVVYKTYKYRVYPTQEQTAQIELTFKMCAFVWNKFLERLTKAYRRRGESLTIFDCDHILTQMKDDYPWLAQVDNKAMRCTIRNLFDAKKAFYRRLHAGEKPGYPRYKSEHNPVSSYTTNAVIHVTDDYIQLPKVKRLKYKRSRPIEGSIVEATVTRDVKGRYYVSICCAVEAEPLPTLDTSVTIRRDDVDFAVDSNGTCYAQPENLDQQYRRLRGKCGDCTGWSPAPKITRSSAKRWRVSISISTTYRATTAINWCEKSSEKIKSLRWRPSMTPGYAVTGSTPKPSKRLHGGNLSGLLIIKPDVQGGNWS